jgi:hypothetical protein
MVGRERRLICADEYVAVHANPRRVDKKGRPIARSGPLTTTLKSLADGEDKRGQGHQCVRLVPEIHSGTEPLGISPERHRKEYWNRAGTCNENT